MTIRSFIAWLAMPGLMATSLATVGSSMAIGQDEPAVVQQAESKSENQETGPHKVADPRQPKKTPRHELRWVQIEELAPPPVQIRAISKDGKIRIVGSDGKPQEIDVSGAQKIIIHRNVQSVDEDGETKVQIQGKAIVIGPDGKRREIDLAGQPSSGEGHIWFVPQDKGYFEFKTAPQLALPPAPGLPPVPGQMQVQLANIGKYMIGVFCEPAGEDLRAQLDLPDGVGLVVRQLPDGSPAAEAGVQQYDLLVYADDHELKSLDDLVKAVNAAGEEDRELSLKLLRRGKERSVTVKPAERPGLGAHRGQIRGLMIPEHSIDLDVQEFGPGIILGLDDDLSQQMKQDLKTIDENMQKTLKQQIEQMERQMQNLSQQMKQLKKMTDDSENRDRE